MPKLSLLNDHIQKKMQEWEFLGVTSARKWFKILLHSEFSKNLTLKVFKPMKGMKVIWWCHQISGYHCLEHVAIMTGILMNHQWLSSVNFAHNHTKFSVYKPPNLLNIIFLEFPEIESSENCRIQFLKAFSADFLKILPSKTYCCLKMFLLSAQNTMLSSYVEGCVKKNSRLNFIPLIGFQASKTWFFLQVLKSFSGRNNCLKPPVLGFCDSLPFGLEEPRE